MNIRRFSREGTANSIAENDYTGDSRYGKLGM